MKKRITVVASFALLASIGLLYAVLWQYPKCIKSVPGPDGLSAQLHIRPHRYRPLWRYLPGIVLGEPHDNIEIHMVVKNNEKTIRSELLVHMGDLIVDHDDTTLVWSDRHLTVTEEHSKDVIEFDF